jgi:hypothetical protein
VLACCALLTAVGLATVFLPDQWALFAFLVAVTAPFTIHDIYFTWPKLAAAGCVLLAAYLAFRGRYLFAGLAIGFGYLVHPSTLMSIPAVAGIIIIETRKNSNVKAWIARIAAMAAGVGAWLLLWSLINFGHNHQGVFLTYLVRTPGWVHTPMGWLRSRLDSLLNTFVPFNLFLFHRYNLDIQSIYGLSPPVIRFFLQYWNTLPFGSGIAFFLVGLLRLLYLSYRKACDWFFALLVIPVAVFIVYWGWSNAGALREGLHAWFLGLMIFAVIMWHRFLRKAELFFRLCNWALLFRALETLCMMLLPTFGTEHVLAQPPFFLSDTAALIAVTAATVCLYIYFFRRAEELRTGSLIAH